MTEPNVDQPGMPGDKPAEQQPASDKIALDKAEYDQLQEVKRRMGSLDDIAKQAEYGTAEEYFDDLEATAYAEKNKPEPAPAQPQPGTPPEPAKPPTPENPEIAELRQKVTTSQQQAAQNMLLQHETSYKVDQSQLPSEERCVITTADLKKEIMKNPQLVAQMATRRGGNLFDGAAALMATDGVALTKAREQGAQEAEQRRLAAEATSVGTGGRMPAPASTGAQLTQEEIAKELCNRIAPTTTDYVGD